jgi:hypothetical protein
LDEVLIYDRPLTQQEMGALYSYSSDTSCPHLIPVPSPTTNRRPTFAWHPVHNGGAYVLVIDTVYTFATPILALPLSDTFYTPQTDLPIDTIYWHVKADSTWYSETGVLHIVDTRIPMLIPYEPKVTGERRPVLRWHSVSGASSYTIAVDTSASFAHPIVHLPQTDTSYTASADLPFGTIRWKVKSSLIDAWSDIDEFVIQEDTVPFLIRYNGAYVSNPRPSFRWHPVAGATSYRIQAADNPLFQDAISVPLSDTTFVPGVDLDVGTWYWRVSCNLNSGLYSPPDSVVIITTGSARGISTGPQAGALALRSTGKGIKIIFPRQVHQAVRLDLYSLSGSLLRSFRTGESESGSATWSLADDRQGGLPPGTYAAVLRSGTTVVQRNLLTWR